MARTLPRQCAEAFNGGCHVCVCVCVCVCMCVCMCVCRCQVEDQMLNPKLLICFHNFILCDALLTYQHILTYMVMNQPVHLIRMKNDSSCANSSAVEFQTRKCKVYPANTVYQL